MGVKPGTDLVFNSKSRVSFIPLEAYFYLTLLIHKPALNSLPLSPYSVRDALAVRKEEKEQTRTFDPPLDMTVILKVH